MPFSYFGRLSARQQKIYLQSDRVREVRLPHPELLHPFVQGLREALASEDRKAVELAATYLVHGLSDMLAVSRPRIQVLAARPRSSWGELQGLYTEEEGQVPRIQVWMRTAANKRIVAWKTFLRTLIHEVGHHLDYTYMKLPDSLHTQGFFSRESSIVHQLLPELAAARAATTGGPEADE